jgi:signal transduction histidine kinase
MNIDPIKHIAKDARILIVDDEKKNVATVGQILSNAGYAICISITDPREAAAKFEEMQPDLLLLDWHMGDFSGLDVLRTIRENMPDHQMPPVLVLTADDSPQTRREALAAGVSDFLSKPLDYSEVLLRIHNLLMLRMFRLAEEGEKKSLEDQVREKTGELEHALADLKASQHQVIQQERLRALGAMAAGIAHDFNNVLSVVLGYSEMFQEKESILAKPEAALEAFGIIGKAAADGSEIVRRLREFYRPYRPGEDVHRPVDLREIVSEAVQLAVPRWKTQPQARGIFIDVKMELGEVSSILGAEAELREVAMNLIFNAVDAMPNGGQIAVRTGMEGELAFFEVEDSGQGMSQETLRHCMEPFYTTKGLGGTGLGLATTHGIVRRHAGYIGIDSDIGQGTRFTILFPVSVPAEGAAPSPRAEGRAALIQPLGNFLPGEARATSAPGAGAATPPPAVDHTWASAPVTPPPRARRVPPHSLRVLVVDDQADICQVLRLYLEADAHKVETAQNGREALEKFRHAEFDVVITDRAMPRMNGEQLASAIKGIRPGEPVILLTGYGKDTEKLSPDIDLQVDKPASLHKIRQAIQKVMMA